MILNSTKFGGNRTKDVEVGPHRQTDRQTSRFLYTPQTMFAGGINMLLTEKNICSFLYDVWLYIYNAMIKLDIFYFTHVYFMYL